MAAVISAVQPIPYAIRGIGTGILSIDVDGTQWGRGALQAEITSRAPDSRSQGLNLRGDFLIRHMTSALDQLAEEATDVGVSEADVCSERQVGKR